MSSNKIDKSTVCTAFACAMASFACGFAFCLALLSNSGSCYLLLKDFWSSTYGYLWLSRLSDLNNDVICNLIIVGGSVLLLTAIILGLRKSSARRRWADSSSKGTPSNNSVFGTEDDFVGESEVAATLQSCRRSSQSADWQKLDSFEPAVLARYLKNENRQVVAIVLARISPAKAADVLTIFDTHTAADILLRMSKLSPIDATTADNLSKTIVEALNNDVTNDNANQATEILKRLNPVISGKIARIIGEIEPTSKAIFASSQKSFADLQNISSEEWQKLIGEVGEPKTVIALRGVSENFRRQVLSCLPTAQGQVIRDTLLRLGPVKLRDIEKAQQEIVETYWHLHLVSAWEKQYD